MNAPGTSGPAGLYSSVALANAENLSSLFLLQMANPGSPIIYGDANLTTDFRSGKFLAKTPEMVLQSGGMGKMTRYYNLPNEQGGCLTDALKPGPQAVMEKMFTTQPLVLSGVDIVQGMGALECSNTMSQEQIVVDIEIARQCRRIQQGIEASDRVDYFSEIAEIGPGGSFLMTDTTIGACRSGEFYESELVDHSNYEEWVELGEPDMYAKTSFE